MVSLIFVCLLHRYSIIRILIFFIFFNLCLTISDCCISIILSFYFNNNYLTLFHTFFIQIKKNTLSVSLSLCARVYACPLLLAKFTGHRIVKSCMKIVQGKSECV